ncbi:MAG: hypothetical protein AAB839_03280 [Patescibacteria group bacterium]|mgnify:CR=1 FL=1
MAETRPDPLVGRAEGEEAFVMKKPESYEEQIARLLAEGREAAERGARLMGTPEGEVMSAEARGRVIAGDAARAKESPYNTEEYYEGMRRLMERQALDAFGTTDAGEISEILKRRRLEADKAFVDSPVVAETPEGRAAQADLAARMAAPEYPTYVDGIRDRFLRNTR